MHCATFRGCKLLVLCTFRENITAHGPDWTPRRFAQLDFWLVADSDKRTICRDVTFRTDILFPSGHYLVVASVGVKLYAKKVCKS